MGNSSSNQSGSDSTDVNASGVSEEERALRTSISEWLETRAKTILELRRVISDLEYLHRRAVWYRLGAGVAGVLGGALATASAIGAIATGGASLTLTGAGLALVAGGAATGGMTDVIESVKERARVSEAQATLNIDKEKQAEIFERFETALDALKGLDEEGEKRQARIVLSYRRVMDAMKDLWLSSAYMYGWAKSGKAVYKVADWSSRAGMAWAGRAVSSAAAVAGGLAGSVFLLVDIGSVIQHSMQVKKGTHSDAAAALKDLLEIVQREREEILEFFRSLPKPNDPYVPGPPLRLRSTIEDVEIID